MKKILSLILVFAGLFVLGLREVNAEAKTVPFEVDILLDGENQPKQELTGEYGSTYSLGTLPEGYDFEFWVVNGFKKDYPFDHEFLVTENMKLQAVFTKDKHAVLFVDTNGKLVKALYVSNGDAIEAPVVQLSKPGFVLSDVAWLDQNGEALAESATESLVYTAQYERANDTLFDVLVVGAEANDPTGEYKLNAVVIAEASIADFTHWEEDGKVVSYDKNYAFTVVQDRAIEAKTGGTIQPLVTMTPNLELRDGYETYLGQFFLPEGYELVEYGFLGSDKVEVLTHDSEGVTVIPSNNYNELTKEFVRSFAEGTFVTLRAYVVAKNESGLVYIYNEVEEIKHTLTLGANLTANVTGQIVDGTEVVVTINVPEGKEISAFKVNDVDKLLDIVDNTYTFVITEATSVSVILVDLPITVAEARAKTSGNVFVKGIVTGIANYESGDVKYIFLSDVDGTTIAVYNPTDANAVLVGDLLKVTGTRATHNGLEQIGAGSTVAVLESDQTVPAATVLTEFPTFTADDQGKRYSFEGLTVVSASGRNLRVTDGTTEVLVYVDINKEALTDHIATAVGKKVDLVNIHLGWYNGAQFLMFNTSEVVIAELTDQDKLAADKAALELATTYTEEHTLPVLGANGSVITWVADPAASLVDGKLVIPAEGEVEVTLTATIKLGELEDTKVFTVTLKELGEVEEELLYSIDFEGGTLSSYLRNVDTTLGVEGGLNWHIATESTKNSGVLWNYNASQDTNITAEQGLNIARLDGRNETTITSDAISNVTKLVFDAKFYGTKTDSNLKVQIKVGDGEFVDAFTVNLASTFNTFTVYINEENVQIRFVATGERSNLDNIRIYG